MSFEQSHADFMDEHFKRRKGERSRRLAEGHGHAEKMFLQKVWWPAFGHFEHLHPEFEVSDFRDGVRFLDFAFLKPPLRLAIEIDGYGTHHTNISRAQFSDQLTRQNHLMIDGWRILRFSYDDVKEKPRMCVQTIQQFLGRWYGGKSAITGYLGPEEKEILRWAAKNNSNFAPREIGDLLRVSPQTARKWLHKLVSKGLLIPAGHGEQRVCCYKIPGNVQVDELY